MTTTADGRDDKARILAPLVRLLLNVRVVTLFGVSVATQARTLDAIGVVVLMATTSVLPLLLWRRIGGWVLRHPIAVALDLVVSVLVLAAVGVDTPFTLYVLTTAVLTGILYGRGGGLTLASPLLLGYVVAAAIRPVQPTFATVLLVPLALIGGSLLGAELRRLLMDREAALLEARRSLVRAATAEERARLAREMHDSVAKTLHGILLSAASLEVLSQKDPERARQEVARIRDAAQVASQEARSLLGALRLDDLERSLAEVVKAEVEAFGCDHDLEVSLRLDEAPDPEPEVRHELLQSMREALRNVERHAEASHVEVTLRQVDGRIELQIDDDGVGMTGSDPQELVRQGHHGIAGLHERARLLGGNITLRSVPGQGTSLLVSAPQHQEEAVTA